MPPKGTKMDEVQAKVLVTKTVAEGMPSNPEWVRECMRSAAESMDELALERGRITSEPPRLVDSRDTRLGYVELTFTAPTRVK